MSTTVWAQLWLATLSATLTYIIKFQEQDKHSHQQAYLDLWARRGRGDKPANLIAENANAKISLQQESQILK